MKSQRNDLLCRKAAFMRNVKMFTLSRTEFLEKEN